MLDFISKIFKRQSDTNQHSNNIKEQNESNVKKAIIEEKQKHQAQDRRELMEKIQAQSHDEAALLDLVLHCEFADGRFQAAQFIYSKDALEKIKNAMRNTDKRVVKLMQTRLDIIAQTEKDEQFAHQFITQAEHLLSQDSILLNQVIELDKQVSSMAQFPNALYPIYSKLREQLESQLAIQQNLQRRLLNISKKLDWNETEYSHENLKNWEEQWQECNAEVQAVFAHEKAHSIPKNLLSEVKALLQSQQNNIKKYAQQATTDTMLTEQNEYLQEPNNPSLQTVNLEQTSSAKKPFDTAQFDSLLKQFETALDNGSMQNSRQFERELKGIKLDNQALTQLQKERLQQARSAYMQMQSLAKWSGDVSRNELMTTAEGLATLNLNTKEIVSTVKALRQQWKQLEATSGGASKELWEKFDQLCNTAYAPAAQHFQEIDEQRKANLIKAELALVSMQNQAQALLTQDEKIINWKQVQQLIQQFQQDWKSLNDFDKQHQVKINAQFEEVLSSLRLPLIQRQREELVLREQLIEQAKQIDAGQRNAVEQIRGLQERWQLQAKSIPLRRQDEQTLWDQFRAACDAVFQKRKEFSDIADIQRQDNLKLKIQICENLEKLTFSDAVVMHEITQLLKKSALDWKEIGAIPREQEANLEKRYQAAVHTINSQFNLLREKEKQLQKDLFLKKLSMCQALESMLGNNDIGEEAKLEQKDKLEVEWSKVTSSKSKDPFQSALEDRFHLAKQAFQDKTIDLTSLSQKNIPIFDEILLHLEILIGVESPEALSRERLQKQVEVLQTSMKSGQGENNVNALMTKLIILPVILDADRQKRMSLVLSHID